MEESRAALAEFVRLDDGRRGTIAKQRAILGYLSPHIERHFEGLRRASMPEK
jgi:hypothetical protein